MDNDKIEIFENDIEMYLKLFCEEYNIQDIKLESQSVWNGCLIYIYRHLFKDNKQALKHNPNINNQYNFNIINDICDYYIYMCTIYDKEISVVGFSNLTGISQDIIYQWASDNNTYRNGNSKLSSKGYDIYKKLVSKREESLSNKLMSGKNPVGVIAILNHHYNWSSPYTSDANKTASARISRNDTQKALDHQENSIPSLPDTDKND